LLDKDIQIIVDDDDKDLTKLTGKNKGQMTMRPIIEVYLQDLTFNKEGLAKEYQPYEGIIMNPTINFGEPILKEAKVPAFVLWEAVQTEGSYESAALAYGVSKEEVLKASKYIETLNLQAA
jgi:uncharacterized protein (DUF433 family)